MHPIKRPIASSPKPTFTADDLITALSARTIGDGMTRREIADATGRSVAWVNSRLGDLYRAGRLDVGKAPRPDMLGAMRYQPVYRLRTT